MAEIQSPRGTRDILPDEQPLWQMVRDTASYTAEQMGFRPITVPTYESLSLFRRSIGSGTDVMDKELFLVRGPHTEPGKEEYALRPEGTAGIVRAYIEHGMSSLPQPVKLYSIVNNFRYDRPQKGRYREHTQISIEYLGDSSAFADAWVIYCTYRYLTELGLNNLKLIINTLGTPAERNTYGEKIQEVLRPIIDSLTGDSQTRLEKNPLRILDSKDANDQEALASVPPLRSFLGEESSARYAEVLALLDQWEIPYEQNDRLVRGLDYYNHTAFEWLIQGNEGQQSSLGGGGRYDGLVGQLGGPATPAVGAGLGLERVMEAIQAQGGEEVEKITPDIFVVAADETSKKKAMEIINLVLNEGWSVDTALGKDGISSQMKSANRSGATIALIIGEQELSTQSVQMKILATGDQENITESDLVAKLSDILGQACDCDNCSK